MDVQCNLRGDQDCLKSLPYPLRMLIVGASHTGKTFLVRKMLMRGDLGLKKELEVCVYSPSAASRQQPIWKDLRRRGWRLQVFPTVLGAVTSPRALPHRLLILDDVDGPTTGKGALQAASEVFTTESHHSNSSCIMISHRLKTGSPALRDSVPYVVLTAAPRTRIRVILKDLDIEVDEEKVADYLLETDNPVDSDDLIGRLCHRHIILSRSPGTYPLWTVPDTYCGQPGLLKWQEM